MRQVNARAIVTFGTGKYAELLEIALPSFKAFAARHGYDLLRPSAIGTERPAPWYKIRALQKALETYDEVLFIGADCVIVDPSDDIEVPGDAWQGLVRHHTGDGDVPNTEFWLCRKAMLPELERVWGLTQWLHHGWWEQAALLELMGYHVIQPTRLIAPTELYERTHFLDAGWNVHKWDQPQPTHPRVQHATMWPDRAAIMREWAKQAEEWIG
jgi:hypothetical protein